MLTRIQDSILYHLGYEWWMLRATFDLLKELPEDADPVRNALLESYLIHARALIVFFSLKPLKNDDWTVTNLDHGLEQTVCPSALEKFRKIINKHVAHLTESRLRSINEYPTVDVQHFLEEQIENVRTNLGDDMPVPWIGDYQTKSNLLMPVGPTGEHEMTHLTVGPTGPAEPSCGSGPVQLPAGPIGPIIPCGNTCGTGVFGPTGSYGPIPSGKGSSRPPQQ